MSHTPVDNFKKEKITPKLPEHNLSIKGRFIPGGIHLPESKKFWKKGIKPGQLGRRCPRFQICFTIQRVAHRIPGGQ